MLKCLRNIDRGPSVINLPEKDDLHKGIEAVILIPGHNRDRLGRNQGMMTYSGIFENHFNSVLAERVRSQANLNQDDTRMPVHVLYRNSDNYGAYCIQIKKEIRQLCRDFRLSKDKVLVVELHLNAAGIPEARGCESLVVDHHSALIASTITNIFSIAFNIHKRGLYRFNYDGKDHQCNGVKMLKRGQRGSGVLRTIKSLGCMGIVFEPCFADYRTEESSQFLDDKSTGIDLLVDFWMDILKVLR